MVSALAHHEKGIGRGVRYLRFHPSLAFSQQPNSEAFNDDKGYLTFTEHLLPGCQTLISVDPLSNPPLIPNRDPPFCGRGSWGSVQLRRGQPNVQASEWLLTPRPRHLSLSRLPFLFLTGSGGSQSRTKSSPYRDSHVGPFLEP